MILFKPFQSIYQDINNYPNFSQKIGQRILDALNTVQGYIQQLVSATNTIPTTFTLYGPSTKMTRISPSTVPDGTLFWQTDNLHLFQAQKQTTSDIKWIQII